MKKIISFIVCLLATVSITNAQNTNSISGKLVNQPSFKGFKIVFSTYKSDQLIEDRKAISTVTAEVNDKGEFSCRYPVPGDDFYMQIEIFKDNIRVTDFLNKATEARLFSQDGDSLDMQLDFLYKTAFFLGRGSEKMNCQYQVNATDFPTSTWMLTTDHTLTHEPRSAAIYRLQKALLGMKKAVLESYQGVLSSTVYARIGKDILYKIKHDVILKTAAATSNPDLYTPYSLEAGALLLKTYTQDRASLVAIDSNELKSPYRCQYILDNAFLLYAIKIKKKEISQTLAAWMLFYVKSFKSKLKEDILIAFYARYGRTLSEQFTPEITAEFMALMTDKENKKQLTALIEDLGPVGTIIPYEFADENGHKVTSQDLKNKIVLMDFWFTGCLPCTTIPPILKSIMERLKHRSDVVYLSVSLDPSKEVWHVGLQSGKYTVPGEFHVFTEGRNHPFVKKYRIGIAPQIVLIGKKGKIISFNEEIRRDKGERVIQLIEKEK